MSKVAIMQPYFMPYIGYFQLINAVDLFVVYDNIEYTKKGWINRNRILANGKDEYITLPLKKDSDYLPVCERYLADTFEQDAQKMLRKLKECYRKAPFFKDGYSLAEAVMHYPERNLFRFIYNSLKLVCSYLNIQTPFLISSDIQIEPQLKAEKKVISICKALGAKDYINPIGGTELYSHKNFYESGLRLHFLQSKPYIYQQFNNPFISSLSIVDVIMFNPKDDVKIYLKQGYDLLSDA